MKTNWILALAAIMGQAGLLTSPRPLAAEVSQEAVYPELRPDSFMKRWLVLSPIPISEQTSPAEEAQKEAFGRDFLESAGGETGVRPEAGARVAIDGKEREWRFVESPDDRVNLQTESSPAEYCIGYAWAEFDLPEAAKALLGLGSDDAVKVWLNGKLVHEKWTARSVQPDDDLLPLELSAGRNRLLLKVQNIQGPWGFACRLMGPEAHGISLVQAARQGDVDKLKLLLDHGAAIDSRNPAGLTAAQAARLRGQKEVLDFLASRGADIVEPIPPREKLVEGLFRSIISTNKPGAAVLVAKDGTILFEAGYGLANVEHNVPITPETKFRIGSVTKQITAAAILKLQEEGKLSVEDKLSKFVPDFPRGDEVTIHHLLTHTSGIHSYTGKPDFLESVTVGVKPEDHINSFKNDPYDFNPGEKWAYNNSGYFLLGYIIEKVSGQSYGEYLRSAFFEPLGMNDTGVHEATAILPHEASGYAFEGGQWKKALNWDMSRAGGAGALYSTVRDLHRWNEAVFGGKALQESSLKAAFTPVRTADEDPAQPKESGYGYGWMIQQTRGVQQIAHSGGLHGFLSYLARVPEKKFTVAVLVNCAPPAPGLDPTGLANEIIEIYLGEELQVREALKVAEQISPEALEAIAGRYDYGPVMLTVRHENGKVFARVTGQPELEIFPRNETNFFWKAVEAEVTFVKDAEGKVEKAIHRQGGVTLTAPRLPELQPVQVAVELLDSIVGRYDYGGGKLIMTITRAGERLFAQLTGQPRFEIVPMSETEFVWKDVNARVTFVRDEQGKVIKAVHHQGGRTLDAPRLQ